MNTSEKNTIISPLSWLILIGYLLLTIVTIILINSLDWALDLFEATETIVHINGIWFSLLIAVYGFFALRKNYTRARLNNLNLKLDSQFLLVVAFLLFAFKEILDFIVHSNPDTRFANALDNGAIVLNFGGYVACLGSIYFGRKK